MLTSAIDEFESSRSISMEDTMISPYYALSCLCDKGQETYQHHEVSTESQLPDGKAGVQVPPCQVIGAVAGGTLVALSDGL